MGKFREFITAVFWQWDTLMSGFLGLVLLWVASWFYNEYYGPGTLPWYGYVIVALILSFIASYRAWLEKDRLLTSATEDVPHFTIRIHGAVSHFDRDQSVTLVIIPIRVINQGAPSAILDYSAHYESPELNQKGKLVQLPEILSLTLPDKQIFIVRPEDTIYAKGSTPIPRGGFINGRLLFAVPGDRRKAIENGEAKIIITIKDYLDKKYTKEFVGSGPRILTYIPGDTIPPGSRGIVPKNPKSEDNHNTQNKNSGWNLLRWFTR